MSLQSGCLPTINWQEILALCLVFQTTLSPLKKYYTASMLVLELFISKCCPSCVSAIALAKKAVEEVPCVNLIFRSGQVDRERAQSLGIIITPTFVLEGKICEVGVPKLEQLIRQLRELSQGRR